MRRLSVREISLSEIYTNKDFRFDSAFWTTQVYKNPDLKYIKIGKALISSQYGLSIAMTEKQVGTPIYRMNEIHNMLCDHVVDKYAELSEQDIRDYTLNDRDVLFNRTNSFEWVGRTGLFFDNTKNPFVFASYLVRFVPDEKLIYPEYLTAYLNCKYGITAIKSRARESINQTNVNPEEVKEIEIPLLGEDFQRLLSKCFVKANKLQLDSSNIYLAARRILLSELGLLDWEPSTQTATQKNLSEFHESGRLDAEYYQPKYDELRAVVEKNAKKICLVSEIQEFNARGLQPIYDSDGLLDVINSKHILDDGLDYDNFEKTSISNWEEQQKAQVFRNDILIYTTGANIGRTAIYLSDKQALASNHVNILRVKAKDKIYVAFVLNSLVGRLQTEKLSAGSAQQELYPKDVVQFYVPFISDNKQAEISLKILEFYALRSQSIELLGRAKRAVEVAIESGESAALAMLKSF